MCCAVGTWQLLPGIQSLFRLVSNTINEGKREQLKQYITDFISDVEVGNDTRSLKMVDAVLAVAVHTMQFDQNDSPSESTIDDFTEMGHPNVNCMNPVADPGLEDMPNQSMSQ
jgi:hypothetical protein